MSRSEITGKWVAAKTAPLAHRTAVAPPVDNLSAVLHALLDRKGYDVNEEEQRVLRACLRLAGSPLPIMGGCDLDFFVALDAFLSEKGVTQKGLSPMGIAHVVAAASQAVGATGRFALMRAAWFDAFEAPALVHELSSTALLVRALRRNARRA